MPSKSLEKRVRRDLANFIAQSRHDSELAEVARKRGDIVDYLAQSSTASLYLGNLYWILGEKDQARTWYERRAELILETHQWYLANRPEDLAARSLVADSEAMVKAGLLTEARGFLARACREELSRGIRLDATRMLAIGMLAAQIGCEGLVPSIKYYIDSQQRMVALASERRKEVFALFLHHPWAQARFLQGDYEACRGESAPVLEAEVRVAREGIRIYDALTQSREAFELARGLMSLLQVVATGLDQPELAREVMVGLWNSLSLIYRCGWSWEIYQRRLILYMAVDMLQGRKPNPNPFAAR